MSVHWMQTPTLVELEPITDDEQDALDYSHGATIYMDGDEYECCENLWQQRGWKDARMGEQVAIVVDAVFAAGGCGEDADFQIGEVESWGWIQ